MASTHDDTFDDHLGPWYAQSQVQVLLGCTVDELVTMRHERQLIGIMYSDANHYYPARQFDTDSPTGLVPNLQAVLSLLAEGFDDPEVWATWLAGSLQDGTIVYDALRAGRLPEVLLTARHDVASWTSP